MLANIPEELQQLNQWVCWREETLPNGRKTKVPYTPNGKSRADVSKPATWGTFAQACDGMREHNMTGVGLVLTEHDPYAGIDIDDKLENPATEEQLHVQQRILSAFDSYTERSVGARWVDDKGRQRGGYHIIVRGVVGDGRDREHVGVYSQDRYLTFTGEVVHAAPIREQQALLNSLLEQMPLSNHTNTLVDLEGHLGDAQVVERASAAVNGQKFDALCNGRWQELGYPSQSEADFALVAMLAFYTRDNNQVMRLFRMTALGRRDKAQRDEYILRMIAHMRSKPVIGEADLERGKQLAEQLVQVAKKPVPAPTTAPQSLQVAPAAPVVQADGKQLPRAYNRPPGIVGDLAEYFYSTAVRPVPEMALAGALAYTAGIVGRAYNISGTGLNQYLFVLARTGTGKESVQKGISTMTHHVRKRVPAMDQFIGPSAFASGQALIRVLDKQPSFVSVLGEFGHTLQQLNDPRAPAATLMLRRVMLDLYNKSGWDDVLLSTAYSDTDKNTKAIRAPNVTLLGESTPERFYDKLSADDIADGLVPRLQIIEYTGKRPARNQHAGHQPTDLLIARVADMAAQALTAVANNTVSNIPMSSDARTMLDDFDAQCDRHINNAHNAVDAQLWNRAHLKALKLAALLAVGCNPAQPVVDATCAAWAIEFVLHSTKQVLRRFTSGDVGYGDSKQEAEVRRVLLDYLQATPEQLKSYGITPELYAARLFPRSFIWARIKSLRSFYEDRRGVARALDDTLGNMVRNGALEQVDRVTAWDKYRKRCVLFMVGDGFNH